MIKKADTDPPARTMTKLGVVGPAVLELLVEVSGTDATTIGNTKPKLHRQDKTQRNVGEHILLFIAQLQLNKSVKHERYQYLLVPKDIVDFHSACCGLSNWVSESTARCPVRGGQ